MNQKKKYRKYFKTHTQKTTTFEYLEIITFIANSYLPLLFSKLNTEPSQQFHKEVIVIMSILQTWGLRHKRHGNELKRESWA